VENDEIRMTSDETNPNYQIVVRPFQFGTFSEFAEPPSEDSRLVIPSSFDIRNSVIFLHVHPCNPWFSSSNYGESHRLA
jgi:hypothetical protein